MACVYVVGPAEGTEWCHTVNSDDLERLIVEIDGTPRRATWKPIPMKIMRKALRHRVKPSDSPFSSSSELIFRPSAIEKMKPILDAHGELLPLACPDAELWVFNPTIVLDALDNKASIGSRDADGEFIIIDKYAFHAGVVKGVDMFKLANWRASPTFVSDRFVDLWHASRLRGLVFKEMLLSN